MPFTFYLSSENQLSIQNLEAAKRSQSELYREYSNRRQAVVCSLSERYGRFYC